MTRQSEKASRNSQNCCLSSHFLDCVTLWDPAVGSVSVHHEQQEAEAGPAGEASPVWLTACGHVSSSSCLGETVNAKFLAWSWKWRGISPINHPWGRLPVPGRQFHTGRIHVPLFSTLMILTVTYFYFLYHFWGDALLDLPSFFRAEISLGYLHIFIIWSF